PCLPLPPFFLPLHRLGRCTGQSNPPVRWIKRILRFAQKLIGKPPDLRNLRPSQTLLLHQSSRGIGAVRRELPIPIIPLPAIRLRIGMALYRNFVRQFASSPASRSSNSLPF